MSGQAKLHSSIIDNLLTRLETAELLGVTPRSLDRWAWRREGPTRFKIGRLTYYDKRDIADWLMELKLTAIRKRS